MIIQKVLQASLGAPISSEKEACWNIWLGTPGGLNVRIAQEDGTRPESMIFYVWRRNLLAYQLKRNLFVIVRYPVHRTCPQYPENTYFLIKVHSTRQGILSRTVPIFMRF